MHVMALSSDIHVSPSCSAKSTRPVAGRRPVQQIHRISRHQRGCKPSASMALASSVTAGRIPSASAMTEHLKRLRRRTPARHGRGNTFPPQPGTVVCVQQKYP
jgi:hypothetical protein